MEASCGINGGLANTYFVAPAANHYLARHLMWLWFLHGNHSLACYVKTNAPSERSNNNGNLKNNEIEAVEGIDTQQNSFATSVSPKHRGHAKFKVSLAAFLLPLRHYLCASVFIYLKPGQANDYYCHYAQRCLCASSILIPKPACFVAIQQATSALTMW